MHCRLSPNGVGLNYYGRQSRMLYVLYSVVKLSRIDYLVLNDMTYTFSPPMYTYIVTRMTLKYI